MRLLRDFKCENSHITELFIDSTTESIKCEICGEQANKTLGYGTIKLDGTDPSFPGAYNRWATIREQRARITAKNK